MTSREQESREPLDEPPNQHALVPRGRVPIRLVSSTAILLAWLGSTCLAWVGYAGDDDLFYARYGFLLHRPPINWWEFRSPAVLAIHVSFSLFGPSELAAALPTLLSSLVILAAVAWVTDWYRRPSWEASLALGLAATFPLDAVFRSVPGAGLFASGFLGLGAACLVNGKGGVPFVGSLLLAFGFLAHEASVYYVAILCSVLLLVAAERTWRAVVLCVCLSLLLSCAEGLAYSVALGDFLARFRTAAGTTSQVEVGVDPAAHLEGPAFFLWPLQNLLISKQWGFDLVLLLVSGTLAWRRLATDKKVLLVSTLGVYVWLGYGTQVPWAYKPFYRQFHYYFPLTVGVAAVLPFALRGACRDARVGKGIGLAAICTHILCLAAGGRWGQNVDVSRALMNHAAQHPGDVFLTDVATMNHMYVLGGFRLPRNVVCLNSAETRSTLLVNREPAGTPRISFPVQPVDGILINLEHASQRELDGQFLGAVAANPGAHQRVAEVRYRPLFAPLIGPLTPRPFMLRSLGGEVIRLNPPRLISQAEGAR